MTVLDNVPNPDLYVIEYKDEYAVRDNPHFLVYNQLQPGLTNPGSQHEWVFDILLLTTWEPTLKDVYLP